MEEDFPQTQRAPLRRPVRSFVQPKEEKKERIQLWMGAALVIVAFSIDLFEMLLEWLGIGIIGMSTLISLCTSLIFWIWFQMLGVSFIGSPKRFATMLTTSVIELIPGFDASVILGFAWTIGIITLVVMTMAEDKGGVLGKAAKLAQGKMKP